MASSRESFTLLCLQGVCKYCGPREGDLDESFIDMKCDFVFCSQGAYKDSGASDGNLKASYMGREWSNLGPTDPTSPGS